MLVSIITPSFNQGEYLEETILSVLNQDYPDIEYIVIDGGSSDKSVDVIKKYAERLEYWISEPDKGQADAINKGIRKSKGALICWINSDDILFPGFVSTRVKQFSENPEIGLIYGDVYQGLDPDHKVIRIGAPADFMKMLVSVRVPIPQQSAVWRRSVIQEAGELDIRWHVLLDWEFFMRVARWNKILYVPGALAFFRNHEKSKSVSDWRKWADELEEYYCDLFSDALGSEYKSLRQKSMAAMYYKCSLICKDCNDIPARNRYLSLSKRTNFCYFKRLSLKHKFRSLKIKGKK